jgi:hypothetical protein
MAPPQAMQTFRRQYDLAGIDQCIVPERSIPDPALIRGAGFQQLGVVTRRTDKHGITYKSSCGQPPSA